MASRHLLGALVIGGGTLALALAPHGAPAQDLDPALVQQPDGVSLFDAKPQAELVEMGKALYEDPSLSPNEMTCNTCHADLQAYNDTFNQPYPHEVAMAKGRAGLDQVNAAEMVQLCMVVPMAAEPLDWQSEELAALAAYVEELQKEFAAR